MNWQNVAILDGVPVVACEELQEQMQQGGEAFLERVQLVDVRRREEFVGELGHIDGAKLVVLGAELQEFFPLSSAPMSATPKTQIPFFLGPMESD